MQLHACTLRFLFPRRIQELITKRACLWQGYLYDEQRQTSEEQLNTEASRNSILKTWHGDVQFCVSDPVPLHPFVQKLHDDDEHDDERYDEDTEAEDESEGDAFERSRPAHGKPSVTKSADRAQQDKSVETFTIEDSSVQYWSDYLRAHYHPRTCHDLPLSLTDNYKTYGSGVAAMNDDRSLSEEWEDNLHWWMEECDSPQGFHLWVDADTGFASVASRLVAHLADDFHHLPVSIFACAPRREQTASCQASQAICQGMALAELYEHAATFIPLRSETWPTGASAKQAGWGEDLVLEPDTWFRSSALVAACVDTASLAYRLKGGQGCQMQQWAQRASMLSRYRLAALHTWLPLRLPLHPSAQPGTPESGLQLLLAARGRGMPLSYWPSDAQPSPCPAISTGRPFGGLYSAYGSQAVEQAGRHQVYSQCVVARGYLPSSHEWLRPAGGPLAPAGRPDLSNDMELLQRVFAEDYGCAVTCAQPVLHPLPLPLSFPTGVFAPRMDRHGRVVASTCDDLLPPSSSEGGGGRDAALTAVEPASVGHMTALQSGSAMAGWLAAAAQQLHRPVDDAARFALLAQVTPPLRTCRLRPNVP